MAMLAQTVKDFIPSVYRKKLQNRGVVFFLSLGVVLLALFFLHPHFRSLVLGPAMRDAQLDRFVHNTKTNQELSLRSFWQFREEYSPGSFTFDPGVVHLGTQVIRNLPETGQPLHTFTSRHSVSRDFVVQRDDSRPLSEQAEEFLASQTNIQADQEQTEVLYQDETSRIFRTANGNTILFFFRPIEDLMGVDGLFDYTRPERELLQNTFWVNITELS